MNWLRRTITSWLCRIVGGSLRVLEKQGLPEETERKVREELKLPNNGEIARAYRASDRLLRERNLRHAFGMQSCWTPSICCVASDNAFASAVRGRYRYVLVDEFQEHQYRPNRTALAVGGGSSAMSSPRGR